MASAAVYLVFTVSSHKSRIDLTLEKAYENEEAAYHYAFRWWKLYRDESSDAEMFTDLMQKVQEKCPETWKDLWFNCIPPQDDEEGDVKVIKLRPSNIRKQSDHTTPHPPLFSQFLYYVERAHKRLKATEEGLSIDWTDSDTE